MSLGLLLNSDPSYGKKGSTLSITANQDSWQDIGR